MRLGGSDVRNSHATAPRQTGRSSGSDQEQRLAPELVDHRHAHHREDQIGEADGDCLLVAGDLAETRRSENARQVIENGVDAGQLVKRADGDGQKERVAIFPAEDRFVRGAVLLLERGADVCQFRLPGPARP